MLKLQVGYQTRNMLFAYLLILPALMVILFVVASPLVSSVWLSFHEANMLKLAVILSMAGVLVLFFLTKTISLSTELQPTQDVYFEGVVNRVTKYDNMLLIDVVNPKSTQVIAFTESTFELEKGDCIKIKGETREYEGELEIIADSIELIS